MFDLSTSIPLIALAALLAGVLDTVVGFGGGLLILPVLVVAVGSASPTEAIVLSALIPLGWNIPRIPLLWKLIDMRVLFFFAIGIVPGTFIGGLFLDDVNPEMLRTAIGVLLIVLGTYHVIRLYVDIPHPKLPEEWTFPVIGFIVGGMSALIGAGNGPFQTWSMVAAGIPPREIIAVNGAIGILTGTVRLISYGTQGLLKDVNWMAGMIGFATAMIGALIGIRISRRASDATLKLLIGVVIVVAGIRLLV